MDLVIGLGEVGAPLHRILSKVCHTLGCDIKTGMPGTEIAKVRYMNICIPYSDDFKKNVNDYISKFNPDITVIHSTVPIGTTTQFPNAVNSPILGRHVNMEYSIRNITKWVGGERAEEICLYFSHAGLRCRIVKTPEETEALKLMCLAKYGMSIAFAYYQKQICDLYGFNYKDIIEWDIEYNKGMQNMYSFIESKQRPIIELNGEQKIGGHCVVPGTKLLNKQHPNYILEEILKYE